MLTPEEIGKVKETTYFGQDWAKRDGTPCCVMVLSIQRGAKVFYSHVYSMMIPDDYFKKAKAEKDLAEWLNFYVKSGEDYIPSPDLLHEHLRKEKKKIFKRAIY
jgi:hypothetical protein